MAQSWRALAALLVCVLPACLTATGPDVELATRWADAAQAGDVEAQLATLHEEVGLYVDGALVAQGPAEYELFVTFARATGSASEFATPEPRGRLGVVIPARVGGELSSLLGVERSHRDRSALLLRRIRA